MSADENSLPRIVIVDVASEATQELACALAAAGYAVLTRVTARAGIAAARASRAALVILEAELPDATGFDACRALRADDITQSAGIIIAATRASVEDRLRGLEAGADDYIGKPCDVRELVLRAQVIDRRRVQAAVPVRAIADRPKRAPLRTEHANDPVKLGALEVDPVMHEVRVGGRMTPLRPIEFRLLRVLVSKPGRIYTREELLDGAWGMHAMLGVVNPRTVDVHVRRLRQNLGAAADMIETVHRFGYRARRVA